MRPEDCAWRRWELAVVQLGDIHEDRFGLFLDPLNEGIDGQSGECLVVVEGIPQSATVDVESSIAIADESTDNGSSPAEETCKS